MCTDSSRSKRVGCQFAREGLRGLRRDWSNIARGGKDRRRIAPSASTEWWWGRRSRSRDPRLYTEAARPG